MGDPSPNPQEVDPQQIGPKSDADFEVELDGFHITSESSGEESRDPLESLASEFMDRLREGEAVTVEEYTAKYPGLARRIEEFFPLILAMEETKAKQEQVDRREAFVSKLQNRTIGAFRIVREVGRGGMGFVFEAAQRQTGRHRAIKVLPLPSKEANHTRLLFEQEARTAADLQHRNIVPVLEYGQEDDFCFYVMPLIRGVSLDWVISRLHEGQGVVYANRIAEMWGDASGGVTEAQRQRNGMPDGIGDSRLDEEHRSLTRTSWRKFATIAMQLAQALEHAHQRGTVHRDVKPANLLLDANGHVWVTDFGLAVVTGSEREAVQSNIAGTLRYMAPEQLEGEFDARSDLYSLGITLYELLTQQPAYQGRDKNELIERIRRAERIPMHDLQPDLPDDLVEIVRRATRQNREKRYQSATQLIGDLLRFLNGHPVIRKPWYRRFGSALLGLFWRRGG